MKDNTLQFFLGALSLMETIVVSVKEIVLAKIAASKPAIEGPNANED